METTLTLVAAPDAAPGPSASPEPSGPSGAAIEDYWARVQALRTELARLRPAGRRR